MEPFSLLFLDPPYGKGLAERALTSARDGGWLTPDALIVVEEAADAAFAPPEGFAEIERRRLRRHAVRVFLEARSLHADAGGLDDLAPALDILREELRI